MVVLLRGLEPPLQDYVRAIGGIDCAQSSDGGLDFELHGIRAHIRVKEGGSRITGTAEIAQVADLQTAIDWGASQPLPPTSNLDVPDSEEGGVLLQLIWERATWADLSNDPIGGEVLAYLSAWRDGTEVSIKPTDFDPGDPRDTNPQQAWLVTGDQASWPSADDLAMQQDWAAVGVFEECWTASKQTQVGDLLLFYFMESHKAVHFVARAASAAFYSSNIEVQANGEVGLEQWWVYRTPLIPVEPIRFAELRAALDGQLILRGRSGKFVPPAAITALDFKAVDPAQHDEVQRIVSVPVGRVDLPPAEMMTWEDVRDIAGGTLRLESDVERYIVEPLLRECLRGSHLTYSPQFAIGRKRADFVVLNDGSPCCVIEVKLAINDGGNWADSPDLKQTLEYAAALDCPAVLIDTRRIVLLDRGAPAPSRIIERADLGAGTTTSGNFHELTKHLSSPAAGRPQRRQASV